MLAKLKALVKDKVDQWIDPEITERLEKLNTRLNEYGVDPFGFDPDYLKYAMPLVLPLYRSYFRVQSFGIKNVPPGRVLLISNHSGQIPMDAAMIFMSMFFETDPPRNIRSMVERWVPTLPLISYVFQRAGQIVGTRENCLRLLDREEAILVFPEGTRGVTKTYAHRYQLQEFGLGFMRLALMTNTPIVPVAVVGAEEQAPALFHLMPIAKLIGAPSFPVTPTFPLLGPLGALPLPSKYRIYYGKPMLFSGDPNDEDSVLGAKVSRVRSTIQRMLRDGIKARKNVFW